MITKKKFIKAIKPLDKEYFSVFLVEKNSNPPELKYIYGNLQETLRRNYKTKTKDEALVLMKEEMWEVALEEVKPQGIENYYIREIEGGEIYDKA